MTSRDYSDNGWQDEVDEDTAQARGTRRENG